VVSLAETKFDFGRLPCRKAPLSGARRLVLESLPGEHLDVSVMDAFTGDAVPVHLLAAEAFHLSAPPEPGGVLAVQHHNRYLDLLRGRRGRGITA